MANVTTEVCNERGSRRSPVPSALRAVAGGVRHLVLAGVVLASLVGCSQQGLFPGLRDARRAAGVTLRDVAAEPRRYLGQTVTVRGEVGQLLAPSVFTLRDPGLLDAKQVLVVGARRAVTAARQPAARLVEEGTVVAVTGTVRRYDPALGEDLPVDLDANLMADHIGRATIFAHVVDVAPAVAGSGGRVTGQPAAARPVPSGNVGDASGAGTGADAAPGSGAPAPGPPEREVSVDDIALRPERYAGQRVAVAGLVARVFGPQAFALEEAGPLDPATVLVVPAEPPPGTTGSRPVSPAPLDESVVQVEGTVRRFDLQAYEAAYGPEAVGSGLAAYDGRPAIYAAEVLRFPSLYQILTRTGAFLGAEVEVGGEISAVFGPRVFALESPLGGRAGFLVVSRRPLWRVADEAEQPFVFVGNRARVRGTVRRFDPVAVEREVGTELKLTTRERARYAG